MAGRIFVLFIVALALALPGLARGQSAAGYFGADYADLSAADAEALGWAGPRGVKILSVAEGGPAHKAGLWSGDVLDVLDGLNGAEIANRAGFDAALAGKAPGAVLKLKAWRARPGRLPRELRLGAPPRAVGQKTPSGAPVLRLDSGGHMALIRDIAFTPDGKQIVSASDDKTIRVWDIARAKTVRLIRGEIAPGHAGKIFAMALSRDGKYLAVGGWFHPTNAKAGSVLRLYDFTSGRLVALLKGHENVVNALAFSPDGRHLISGQGGDNAYAIIWDVEKRRVLHRLKGHTDRIYAVGFSPDGELAVTGSNDHTLRLWRVGDGKLIRKMTGHKDKVYALAVAPDGTIASGDVSGEIRLWDGRTGELLRILARQKTNVGSLTFSPDGQRLLSGTGRGRGRNDCHVYDTASGRELIRYRGHDNLVLATAISPDGRWAATGGGNSDEIHIWDLGTGKRRSGPDGKLLSLSGKGRPVRAAGFGKDGRSIAWGNLRTQNDPRRGYGPLEFSLTLPGKDRPLGAPARLDADAQNRFRRVVTRHGAWSLRHRKGGNYPGDAILEILWHGDVVKSIIRGPTDGYIHRAYSFSPDGQTIVSGGANGVLSAYDRAGKKKGDFLGHEGDIWAVAISPDGRTLLSGSSDQTVKLWNLKTRELLVTLFAADMDGRIEWVMWTPGGYLTGSQKAGVLIGWHLNYGPATEAGFTRSGELYKQLYRPGLVARAIEFASAKDAIKEAGLASVDLAALISKPKPEFRIAAPAPGASLIGGYATLILDFAPNPAPLSELTAIIDHGGKRNKVTPEPVPLPRDAPAAAPGHILRAYKIPLGRGVNQITISAANASGDSAPRYIDLVHRGEGAAR